TPPTIAADKTVIAYTLSTNALVTATLRSSDGHDLSTLFSEKLKRGKHTYTFRTQGVTEGHYAIVLTATDGRTSVTVSVPVTVDRTLSALAVIPPVFSPNGDGRDDAVSFAFRLARSAQISIDVKRSSRVVATVFSGVATVGDQSTTWDGRLPSGPIADGTYSAAVTVVSPFGTTTRALPLRVDTVAPR